MSGPASFYISHAGSDQAWAEWVAWQLEKDGYTVELEKWDWSAGQNRIKAMSDALSRADRVVALLSPAYFSRGETTWLEFAALLASEPLGGKLVPIWVTPPSGSTPLLAGFDARRLDGYSEDAARHELLDAVKPGRPAGEPGFPPREVPGQAGQADRGVVPQQRGHPHLAPRLPGGRPGIWNVRARNPGFTGRDGLLAAIRDRFRSGSHPAQALYGAGGVGKTQLAAEYAHRFASEYDVAWWINAEQAELIGERFAALAGLLHCAEPGAQADSLRQAVLAELRRRGRWLLVFDNASNPREVATWLPGANGHVLVTSRSPDWAEVATGAEIRELARAESKAILLDRVPGLSHPEADMVADALGDLPLAIAQAAGYLRLTGMDPGLYCDQLKTHAADLLNEQPPSPHYPTSLAAVTLLLAEQLAAKDAASTDLLGVCACLAAEPIPQGWFTRNPDVLPGWLPHRASDIREWNKLVSDLSTQSIARVDRNGLQFHPLTQAILRDWLGDARMETARACALQVVIAASPGDPDDPGTGPGWVRLMPHLLACDPAASTSAGLRRLACDAAWYLFRQDLLEGCLDFARPLHENWRHRLPEDNPQLRSIGATLAAALRGMGEHAAALTLDQEALLRERRLRGGDHPVTLQVAVHVSDGLRNLGGQDNLTAARVLDADTWSRCRRALGGSHPLTGAVRARLEDGPAGPRTPGTEP